MTRYSGGSPEFNAEHANHLVFEVRICWSVAPGADGGPITDPLREYDVLNTIPFSPRIVQAYATFQDSLTPAFLAVLPEFQNVFVHHGRSRQPLHFVVYEFCPQSVANYLQRSVSTCSSKDGVPSSLRENDFEMSRRARNQLEAEQQRLEYRRAKYMRELAHDPQKLQRKVGKVNAKLSKLERELAEIRDEEAALKFNPQQHVKMVLELCKEIVEIGTFLEAHRIVHRNLSLENLVVAPAADVHGGTTVSATCNIGGGQPRGCVKLTGFTEARSFSRKKTMSVKLRCTNSRVLLVFRSMEHLAPEIINGCVQVLLEVEAVCFHSRSDGNELLSCNLVWLIGLLLFNGDDRYRSAGFGVADHVRVNFMGQAAWGFGSVIAKLLLGLRFPLAAYPMFFEDPHSEWHEIRPFSALEHISCGVQHRQGGAADGSDLRVLGVFGSSLPTEFGRALSRSLSFHPADRPSLAALASTLGISTQHIALSGHLQTVATTTSESKQQLEAPQSLSSQDHLRSVNKFMALLGTVADSSNRSSNDAVSYVSCLASIAHDALRSMVSVLNCSAAYIGAHQIQTCLLMIVR